MNLSRRTIKNISAGNCWVVAPENIFELAEKVLQFGTGVLLRGLPDYYINKANNQGIFNGRIVVVKSTSVGGTNEFVDQEGLYVHCIRGIEDGNKIEENIINAAISRVLSAKEEWNEILTCAENPEMEVVISNTTEVGITLKADDNINNVPPASFPGKLLAFLYKRFQYFEGDAEKGMVIVPTELIPQNGKKLQSIALELARLNSLETAFIDWLKNANHFCDSLVDRIVPGNLPNPEKVKLESEVGFCDNLMIMSEPYSLWAIEADHSAVADKLSFRKADKGIVIAPDITKFRELKLRLLNGTHTFSCGLAYLAGFITVKEAMEDKDMAGYIQQLMQKEIASAIPYSIPSTETADFSNKVLDRFRNPHIEHNWIAITVQYSSKMKMRNVPVLQQHYSKSSTVPELMALGFAAHILFMKCEEEDGKFYGALNGSKYLVQDENAKKYAEKWHSFAGTSPVNAVLSDIDLWGADLSAFAGFETEVAQRLQDLQQGRIKNAIKEVKEVNELR